MKARFVICANGTLSKPKLSKIRGMESFAGHSFHTSRWDYDYTGPDLSGLADQVVGIIGTGASAVQHAVLNTQHASLLSPQRAHTSLHIDRYPFHDSPPAVRRG